jgi:hypothetical protein
VQGLRWGIGEPENRSVGGSGGFEAVFSCEFGVVPSSVLTLDNTCQEKMK